MQLEVEIGTFSAVLHNGILLLKQNPLRLGRQIIAVPIGKGDNEREKSWARLLNQRKEMEAKRILHTQEEE